jgi:hypothetical protein
MNIKQFKHELRLNDIKGDPWGASMEAFFECAGRMNKRGVQIPVSWQYKPGLGGDGTDKDSYYYSLFAHCGNSQLLAIGLFLERYTNYLRKKGRDY